VSEGTDEVVVPGVRRSWEGGRLVPSAQAGAVAFSEDVAVECLHRISRLMAFDFGAVSPRSLWRRTDDGLSDYPLALLPAGFGFLVQHRVADPARHVSAIYAFSFDGQGRVVYPDVHAAARSPLVAGEVASVWPDCATVSRLGPSCELYCMDAEDAHLWHRLTADGAPSELVQCEGVGSPYRITDVHQR
jgi:hypothetical protein